MESEKEKGKLKKENEITRRRTSESKKKIEWKF